MSQYELGFAGMLVSGILAYATINAWAPKRWLGWYLITYLALVCLGFAAIAYHGDVINAEH